MLIRPYTDADFDALRRAHASQGFAHPFPDLRDPIFVSKLVLEDDAGQVVMASLARGLDDAHAWLPPPVAKRFGRRLTALGWIRDDGWTPYCFRLRPNQK